MTVIPGNILNVTRGVVCHQVNCRHKAGAGLALQMRQRYPGAIAAYMAKAKWELGDVLFCAVGPELYIAHLAGQYGYGSDHRYTDYGALETALIKAAGFAIEKKLPLCLPYGIGCGLAGGKWNIVQTMIEKVCPDAVLYRI